MNISLVKAWFYLIVALIAVTCWRLWARSIAGVDLFFDEAYYWGWAQSLDWGYYSKPPMVAWIIHLTTSILGDTVFALRLGAAILYPLTALLIFLLGRILFASSSNRNLIALVGALTFISLPVIAMGTWFMTTDAPLLFFWALALIFYALAINNNSWVSWSLFGVAAGFGLMSKYSMVFFAPCVLLHLWLSGNLLPRLMSPKIYWAALLAIIIFMPNIWWNYIHDFSTYKHTAEISQLDKTLINPTHFLEFFGAQFAVFGFILFGGLLFLLSKYRTLSENPSYILLASFSFVPLILFCCLAITSRAFANWAAFSYVAASLLISAWWLERGKKWLYGGIVLNLLFMAILSHWQSIAPVLGVNLSKKTDPYFRVKAWSTLADAIAPVFAAHPDAIFIGDSRDILAEFSFYLGRKYSNARYPYIYNPGPNILNHYALVADIAQHPQGRFLWISAQPKGNEIKKLFNKAEFIGVFNAPIYMDYSRSAEVWLVEDFIGVKK